MNGSYEIDISLVERGTRLRDEDEAQVSTLMNSIGAVGLLHPITVYQRPVIRGSNTVSGFGLVAGLHRLSACRALEWITIPAIVVTLGELERQIAECDENLCGPRLSPSDQALFTRRRKEAYEALHPETRHGENQHTSSRQVGNSSSERFTADTAAATGRSERAVQRDAERGQKVSQDALDIIRHTKLDTGSYLDKLKKLPAEEQVRSAKRDLVISEKADRAEDRAKSVGARPPAAEPEPVDQFAAWVDLTEQTAELTADAIFAACPVRSRPTLSQRCEAVRAIIDRLDELIEKPPARGGAA
ncbi:ParB/RepB/Spo0J family partition protein [Aureimonas sp. AU22]|uniref:ParB/RepB/Spo0J family partition protein n=1 Tax=Aureimonas sp. AU22 TaxID=1638162 RepID=UPI000782C60F|nr:ParB N-terminal domain-containing protein [Aureimonas sp. AU22]